MGEIQRPTVGSDIDNGFEVDLQWMRYDAQEWESCSGIISEAATSASGLKLTGLELSVVGEMSGLVESYQKLQDWLARLLADAALKLDHTAQALRQTTNNYETTDGEVSKKILASYWKED